MDIKVVGTKEECQCVLDYYSELASSSAVEYFNVCDFYRHLREQYLYTLNLHISFKDKVNLRLTGKINNIMEGYEYGTSNNQGVHIKDR